MTQIATVTEVPSRDFALVTVARKSACGHDCEHCAGCGAQPGSVTVQAKTLIDVEPGDLVELYSGNQILAVAALVYLTPVVLFLLGYMLTPSLTEGMRYVCGGIGFAIGVLGAICYDRLMKKRKTISYEITRKL